MVFHRNVIFQEDNGFLLKFCNVTQSGLETQRQLGTSCSSKVITRNRSSLGKVNQKQCNDAITEAIQKKFPILLMIDDYHNIHTIRGPTDQATSKADHMSTILMKIVKEATAIPFSSTSLVQNPSGIDIDLLVNNLCSVQFFGKVSSCSLIGGSSMPQLTCQAQDVRSLCTFKDVYLIDFVK